MKGRDMNSGMQTIFGAVTHMCPNNCRWFKFVCVPETLPICDNCRKTIVPYTDQKDRVYN
jgi:hypothetical protein